MSTPVDDVGSSAPQEPSHADLVWRVADLEAALEAIRSGGVDAVLHDSAGPQQPIYTLASADRPYRVIVEEMGQGAATISGGSTILYANRQLAQLLGQERSSLLGDSLMRHVDAPDRAVMEQLLAVLPGATARQELTLVRADGTPVPALVSMTALELDGAVVRCLVAADLSDRRKTEAALASAQAKDEFLSRMSHELRTPMNAVLGFGQLLERRLAGTEHVEPIRHVLRAGSHLLALINEVLDISRIETGRLSVSLEPVLVATMAEEALVLMRPLAEAAGVVLTVEAGPPGLHVIADPQRLRQVLLNLVSNAVKYNRAGGGVWISWHPEGEVCVIRVRDDGPGIADTDLDRLFAPFDRLGAEATLVEGTGIGLTLSRGLAEVMGGSVTVESVVGVGSTFVVQLPGAPAPAAATPDRLRADPSAHDEPTGARGVHTLLYIEDNAPNVSVMEATLQLRPEWRMVHAGLVSLGLDLARAHRPTLVLLDVHLPDGNGLEVLTALRSDPQTSDLPVAVLSADASEQQQRRLLTGGANAYLTKPFDLDDLLAVLDSAALRDLSG